MRIDAHVHYMPPELATRLDQFCAEEPYWGLLVGPGQRGRSLQGWASAEQMIEAMDQAGIERVILQGEYRRQHAACVERNNQALEIIRRWPERVIAFAILQPTAGRAALDELQRCLDAGMRGVGELAPYAQGYRLDHPDFLRLAEACIRAEIPLTLHTNEEVGHYYPGKGTTPLVHYYRLACRYPELRLILAHWGGGLLFYELMPSVRRQLRNVYYDTAASPLLFPTDSIFRIALQCVGYRKILVGSDFPLLLYPSRLGAQAQPDFCTFQEEIAGLGLEPEVYHALTGDNAARLLGLIPAERATSEQPDAGLRHTGPGTGAEQVTIHGFMAVSLVAEQWPATRQVFEKYDIPWQDSPVPFWEPIVQAAAARGYGPTEQQRLLDELNLAAGL